MTSWLVFPLLCKCFTLDVPFVVHDFPFGFRLIFGVPSAVQGTRELGSLFYFPIGS